jgi:hypothetical protein
MFIFDEPMNLLSIVMKEDWNLERQRKEIVVARVPRIHLWYTKPKECLSGEGQT